MTEPATVTRVLRLSLGKKAWDTLRLAVFDRDGWRCMARVLDPEIHSTCVGQWGYSFDQFPYRNLDRVAAFLTLNHVHWHVGGTKGKKAADLESNLVSVCWGAHLGIGPSHGFIWATSKAGLEKQRDYLAEKYPELSTSATEATGATI